MSTKLGLLTEGAIDRVLVPPLLTQIARQRAEYQWPVRDEDVSERLRLHQRGHGGVLEAVRHLVDLLDSPDWSSEFDLAGYVILLDRNTGSTQEAIRALIRGKDRFVVGMAIEEIEAWWLADRENTLRWAGLSQPLNKGLRYAQKNYRAEKDDDPKRTLSDLTEESERLDRIYGTGSVDLARDFAEAHWRETVALEVLAAQCPAGFGAFVRDMENLVRHMKARQKPPVKRPRKKPPGE